MRMPTLWARSLTVMNEGEGDDGGGSIATGAAGLGPPSERPRFAVSVKAELTKARVFLSED